MKNLLSLALLASLSLAALIVPANYSMPPKKRGKVVTPIVHLKPRHRIISVTYLKAIRQGRDQGDCGIRAYTSALSMNQCIQQRLCIDENSMKEQHSRHYSSCLKASPQKDWLNAEQLDTLARNLPTTATPFQGRNIYLIEMHKKKWYISADPLGHNQHEYNEFPLHAHTAPILEALAQYGAAHFIISLPVHWLLISIIESESCHYQIIIIDSLNNHEVMYEPNLRNLIKQLKAIVENQ